MYANNCKSKNLLIAFFIFRNHSFAVIIFIKNVIIIINYIKELNDENVAIFKEFNVNVFVAAFKSIVNNSFNIFSLSAFFFSYINYTQL